MDALMFLIKLAYDSRYRLPMLLTVGFMVLDIRMQLEINIHTREVHRQPIPPRPRRRENEPPREDGEHRTNRESEASNDSWATIDDDIHLGDDTDGEQVEEIHESTQETAPVQDTVNKPPESQQEPAST